MMFMQFNDVGAEPPRSYIIIVIEQDNFERMRRADLLTLAPQSIGGMLQPVRFPANLHLLVAYEDPEMIGRLYELQMRGDVQGLVDTITRGWQNLPGDGVRTTMGNVGNA
jgi:hypothetical protein